MLARSVPHDFAARIDWSKKSSFDAANYPPEVVVNRVSGDDPLRQTVYPVETQIFSGQGTTDPDGDSHLYLWCTYDEAGTYQGTHTLQPADHSHLRISVPQDAANTIMHIILRVTDSGELQLTRYHRIILNVG